MTAMQFGPSFTNGGIIVIVGLIAFAVLAVLMSRPPRFRCDLCGAEFTAYTDLTDHDLTHLPRPWCACPQGGVHHPSCYLRASRPKRAA